VKREVADPKTTQRARPAEVKQQTAAAASPSMELLSVVQAAQTIISKVLALCAKQSSPEKVPPTSEPQAIPKYVD